MLRIANQAGRFANRRLGHGSLHVNIASKYGGLQLLQQKMSIWSFDKPDNDSIHVMQSDAIEADASSSSSSSIVSPWGDNSPTPNPLLILPGARRPIFPGYLSAVLLRDEKTIEALTNNSSNPQKYFGFFLRKDTNSNNHPPSDIITSMNDIHSVGTFAEVQNVIKTDGGTQLIVRGHRRISLLEVDNFGPPTIGRVKHWKRPKGDKTDRVKAYMNEIITTVRELLKMSPLLQEQMHLSTWMGSIDFNDPYKLADFATALSAAEGFELQKILEEPDIETRLALVLELLAKDRELAKLQKEINKQVEEKMSKQQREYFLREQLKSIKKELGMEKDDKDDLLEKYRNQLQAIEDRNVPESTTSILKEEMKKLETLEKNSSEFNVTRSYLDWLFAVPWGLTTKDVFQLQKAREILDEDHYGLQEIKTRILEFIAVGKLRGTVNGKIICFVGPPGVGKTSVAISIARALDKKFFRFSVGGLTDTAEIKGHRRTYIGAMPGKPIQSLKTVACINPLILIDEIDKLGRSYNGDPASALLELLDPNQNESFVDHYLDVPVDFSKVLFVCTANDESTIPGPLKDRMEIIRLSGYDIPEKIAIASKYLVPKAIKEAGLSSSPTTVEETDDNVPTQAKLDQKYRITDEALEVLVKNYCRESGVRSLEKKIEKITRKIAFDIVGKQEKQADGISSDTTTTQTSSEEIVLHPQDIEKYLGKPIFAEESIYSSDPLPPGIVMGLAWNTLGGSSLFIETVATPCAYTERDSGLHVLTGQLGDVMKESAKIAYTFARKHVVELNNENKFFNSHQVHLHVPEGAISKDGPSAGVAMATSFISIATNKPVNSKVAMTGELSLTGKVLPVGGIKEKTLAAKRSGAKTIILPFANKRDFDELPDYVRADVDAHFVKDYSEAYRVAFGETSKS